MGLMIIMGEGELMRVDFVISGVHRTGQAQEISNGIDPATKKFVAGPFHGRRRTRATP
jgi:hypothetical protein